VVYVSTLSLLKSPKSVVSLLKSPKPTVGLLLNFIVSRLYVLYVSPTIDFAHHRMTTLRNSSTKNRQTRCHAPLTSLNGSWLFYPLATAIPLRLTNAYHHWIDHPLICQTLEFRGQRSSDMPPHFGSSSGNKKKITSNQPALTRLAKRPTTHDLFRELLTSALATVQKKKKKSLPIIFFCFV
jgi:hypothetical protein